MTLSSGVLGRACITPVMIAKRLPYVPFVVHRGRPFAASTGILQALCLFVDKCFVSFGDNDDCKI